MCKLSGIAFDAGHRKTLAGCASARAIPSFLIATCINNILSQILGIQETEDIIRFVVAAKADLELHAKSTSSRKHAYII